MEESTKTRIQRIEEVFKKGIRSDQVGGKKPAAVALEKEFETRDFCIFIASVTAGKDAIARTEKMLQIVVEGWADTYI